mmetsp:Transcript_39176/g.104013  ORF Transcript_39176/g.104013 Transcript_39176/m.104013 type:complete len:895 (-) Transcript_39176:131-2815(-)
MVSTLPCESDAGVVAHSKASLAAIYDEVDWGALFSQELEKSSGSHVAPAEGSERRRLTSSQSAESTLHTPHNGERSRPSGIVVSEQSRLSMSRRSRSVSWVAGEQQEVRFFRKEDVVPPPSAGPPPSKTEKWEPRPDEIASSGSDSSDSSDESDQMSSHLDGEVRSSLASVLTQQSIFDLCTPKAKSPTQKSSLRHGSAFGLDASTQDNDPQTAPPAGERNSPARNGTVPAVSAGSSPARGSSDIADRERSSRPQDSAIVSDTSSRTVDGNPLSPSADAIETRPPLRGDERDIAPTGSQRKRSSGVDRLLEKSTDRGGMRDSGLSGNEDTSAILPLESDIDLFAQRLQRLEERVAAETGVLDSISSTLAENTATLTESAQESRSEIGSWLGKTTGAAHNPARGSLVLSDDGVIQARPQPMGDIGKSHSLEKNFIGGGKDKRKANDVPKIQLHRHRVDSDGSSNASNGNGRRFSDVAKSNRDAAEESALPLGSSKSQNYDAGHTCIGTPGRALERMESEAGDSGSQSVTTPRSVPWADSKVSGSQSVKPSGSSPWRPSRTGATGVSGSARVPHAVPNGLGNDSASKLAGKPVEQWDETDVASWVASLSAIPDGIAEVVHAHAITGPVLLSLSSDDLAGLNIKKFGHRRLLVLAANELRRAVEGIFSPSGSASQASSNGNLPVQSSPTPNIHMQANSTQLPTKSSQSVQTTKPAPKTTKSPSRYDRAPQLVQANSLSMNRTRSAHVLPPNSLGGLGSACMTGADRARMPAKRFQGAGGHRENSGQRSPAMPGSSSPSAPRRATDAKQWLSPTSSPRHPGSTVPQPLGRVVQVPTMSQPPHSPGRSVSPFMGRPGKSTTTISTLALRREVSSPVRFQCVGPTTSVVQRLTSRPGILT